uniref:Uncharacterized protein n=1 Tax=Arundo donax TaxID=35708 RepID=A0A0A9ASG3_ARUDO
MPKSKETCIIICLLAIMETTNKKQEQLALCGLG